MTSMGIVRHRISIDGTYRWDRSMGPIVDGDRSMASIDDGIDRLMDGIDVSIDDSSMGWLHFMIGINE